MALLVFGIILSIGVGLFLAPYLATIAAIGLGFVLVFGGWALYGHLCDDGTEPTE